MKIYVGYMDEWGEENLLGLFKSESEVDDAVYQKLDNKIRSVVLNAV